MVRQQYLIVLRNISFKESIVLFWVDHLTVDTSRSRNESVYALAVYAVEIIDKVNLSATNISIAVKNHNRALLFRQHWKRQSITVLINHIAPVRFYFSLTVPKNMFPCYWSPEPKPLKFLSKKALFFLLNTYRYR